MIARLRALAACRRGITAVEFALVSPMLISLFLVGMALSDGIACNRKVSTTARAVADLTARYSSVSTSDVTTILAASAQVMAPYNVANAAVRVSEVKVTGSTSAAVVWSRAQNGTALATNATVTVPSGMAATGAYMILGEVSYTYTPPIVWGSAQTMTLSDSVFMSPRLSDQVPLS